MSENLMNEEAAQSATEVRKLFAKFSAAIVAAAFEGALNGDKDLLKHCLKAVISFVAPATADGSADRTEGIEVPTFTEDIAEAAAEFKKITDIEIVRAKTRPKE
jgi:hypothetical protein